MNFLLYSKYNSEYSFLNLALFILKNPILGIVFNASIEFLIGQRNFVVPQNFNGNIDEVAVWISELSASDVTAIYNGGVANDLSGLSPVSWWRMGEDSLYNSGPGLWSFPDNGSGGNNGSSLTFPEAARVSDVPT